VLLLALVGVSAVTDLARRKIYNAFTYPAILAGLLLNLLCGGTEMASATGALVLGGAVFYPFYRAGGMGMGDLKLMAAIGALKGISFWAVAMMNSALAGGLLALGLTLYRGTTRETLLRAVSVPRLILASWRTKRRLAAPCGRSSATIPYGVAIGIGTVATLWFPWLWPL